MRIPSIIFVVLFSIAFVTPVRAQDAPDTGKAARIRELERHVAELQARARDLDNQILDAGGSTLATQAIKNVEQRRDYDAQQERALQTVIEAYTHSVQDMDDLHRQAQNLPLTEQQSFEDRVKSKAEEKAVEYGLKAAGQAGAAELVDPILAGSEFVSVGGRWCIRKIDAAQIRDDLMHERIQLNKVLEDEVKLERQRSEEVVTLRRLHDLDEQHRKLDEQLLPEQHRLAELTGEAHRDAILHRDMDEKGDAAEEAKMHWIHVTRCGDWQPEKPFGVRPSEGLPHDGDNKAAAAPEKIKAVPDKDDTGACTDITGKWTFQTTSALSAKPMPPVHAEIARRETADDAPPAYEIFMPDKERAHDRPFMRCTLSDGRLDCQVAALSMTCPDEKQAWDKLELALVDDGNALTGEYQPGYATDAKAADKYCTATPFKWPGKKTYRFVPAKEE